MAQSEDHELIPSINRRPTARRSGFVCETCRARKVKCDERPGRCSNCERLGLQCIAHANLRREPLESTPIRVGSTDEPRDENTDGLKAKRRRIYQSCTECRKSKTKCNGFRPACRRCQQRHTECIYEHGSQLLPAWARRMNLFHPGETITGSQDADSEGARESPVTLPATEPGLLPSSPEPAQAPTGQAPLSWLTLSNLPCVDEICLLLDEYFLNIHPLQCFAFIHKPSFMQSMQNWNAHKNDNALIHIMCALGAQFYALKLQDAAHSLDARFVRNAGCQWAKKAQGLILADLDTISVRNLMAVRLLQDYAIRMGNFALAFMLSGVVTRMSQALQINLEYSTDVLCRETESGPSATLRESRRRLMWSCYIMDSIVGSGVDQLTLIDEADLRIQLPCNERSFIQQTVCVTETLRARQPLPFVEIDSRASNPRDNMGMIAHFIRLIEIRRRVLRYIKHLDKARAPWCSDSEFALLDAECKAWYQSLPGSLEFTPTAIYIRKETHQLGALCILHCAYHQTMCDLYRLGAPKLYKVRAAFSFPPEQESFLHHLQKTLFEHAKSISTILHEIGRHGTRTMADSWLPTITYDSCRIIVYYITQLIEPAAENRRDSISEAKPFLQWNLDAIKRMQALHVVAEPLHAAARTMIEKFDLGLESARRDIIPDDPYRPNPEDGAAPSAPGTPPQSAPDYVLNPLTLYRMARKEVPEKHAPEKFPRPNTVSPPQPASGVSHDASQTMSQAVVERVSETCDSLEQATFDELQMLFTSDLGWTCQPVGTAMGSGADDAGFFLGISDPQRVHGQIAQGLELWMPNNEWDGIT